ncbi:hypothetical protein QAD02_001257 [Eretmocerus hayati]|uniref:Uncharacterized protein n=1 Tax=Eretmocerus hayati TaxID=131215 RepID=A0ACC2NFQ6_9HYME|nr:hypothetical protein QAD02_001257 [Eretmocerus hayati]
MMKSTKRVRKHRLKRKILKSARVENHHSSSEESNKESDYDSDIARSSSSSDTQSSDKCTDVSAQRQIVDDDCFHSTNTDGPTDQVSPEQFDKGAHDEISEESSSSEAQNSERSGTSIHSDSDEDESQSRQCNNTPSDTEDLTHCGQHAQNYGGEIVQHPDGTHDEVQELKYWVVKNRIAMSHTDELLVILRRRLLPELPASSKTFLQTSSACYLIEEMLDADSLLGEFVYFGIEEGLQACVNPELHPDQVIDLDFNIDGVKIKKSSLKQLWPCLCRVYYKKMPQVYKPFPVLAFYGNKKPKDLKMYFHKFINEMNRLSRTGIRIKGRLFKIRIRRFINDTPARDMVKCTSGHSSLNGCSRCDTVAVKIDDNIVYLYVGNPRTNDDFRSFKDINHHLLEISPLIALHPPIDMILAFILDIMHLFYLGIMLRLFQYWKDGNATVKLSMAQRNELNRRTEMLKGDIPHEFKRKMRSTNHYPDFKATDHRFFVLYCGPIVLKKILSDQCYDHFLLFHAASRMISSKKALDYSRLAKEYLSNFVEESKILYGLKFVSLNVHSLHHVVDDIIHSESNANDLSAFPFETDLCKAKYMLKSPKHTLAQYCRRIHEERSVVDQTAKIPPEVEILKSNENGRIEKIFYKQQYFSTSHPDNTASLTDGSVVKIVGMFVKNGTLCAKVMGHRIIKSLYKKPCDSSLLGIHQIDLRHSSPQSYCIKFEEIATKLVRISINFVKDGPMHTYALPLLHSY